MRFPALLSLSLLALAPAARATVSIEFQLGGISVPDGTLAVLVADTLDNGFSDPSTSTGTSLTVGSTFGDDVVVAVFGENSAVDWSSLTGYAELLAVIDYADLGVAEGQNLILHLFPHRSAGQAIRFGEPHLSYSALPEDTSNSNMDFVLPRDGSACLLAALATQQGGNADLSGLDLADLPYDGGGDPTSRTLSGDDARHTYIIEVTGNGFFSFEGTGAEGLRADLLAPDGSVVASTIGEDLAIYEEIAAGFYTLVLYRESGSGPITYSFTNADSDTRTCIPDLSVGGSLTNLIGGGILNGAGGQTITLTALKAKPVMGYATVANSGERPDRIALRGTRGSTQCAIAYFAPSGNVTAAITSGGFETDEITSTDSPVAIRVAFTPNKRLLVKKKKKKIIVLRKLFSAQLWADSTTGPAAMDSAKLQVQVR